MATPSGSFSSQAQGGYTELANNVAGGVYAAKANDPTYDPWNHYYSDVFEVITKSIDPAGYPEPDALDVAISLGVKNHIREQAAVWEGTGGFQGALWDLTPTDFGGPGYEEEEEEEEVPIGGIIPTTTSLEERQRRGSYYVTGGPEFPEYSQYQQFAGFLGGNPTYQAVSPGARASMRRQFDPLAAQFALQQAMGTLDTRTGVDVPEWVGGVPPQSMTQFLGSGPQAYSPAQTADVFQTLAPMFGPQGFNVPAATPGAQDALQFLSQPGVAENIISQFAQGQVNPMFAASVNRNLQNAFAAFAQQAGAGGDPISDVGGGVLSQFFSPTGIGGWSYA